MTEPIFILYGIADTTQRYPERMPCYISKNVKRVQHLHYNIVYAWTSTLQVEDNGDITSSYVMRF